MASKPKRIDLYGIDRAITDVQRKLRAAGRGADAVSRRRLRALTSKLEAVRKKNADICPRQFTIWPLPASSRRRGSSR